MTRYRKPPWILLRIINPMVRFLIGPLGLGGGGGRRVLEVPGRSSGQPRTTPVNLLELDGARYLLAPRGGTNWVRNLRAAGGGRLRSGRRSEEFRAVEIPDEEKVPVLRAYQERWARETKGLIEAGADAPEDELRAIAPDHPVFRLD
jgi:deazaflavin-dependent oxidoreductase (nitroreductase family)